MLSNPTCDISIDHKKVVDHEILVNKLYHYGFRAIINDWLASYLKNRTQTTQIGQHVSNKSHSSMCYPPRIRSLSVAFFKKYTLNAWISAQTNSDFTFFCRLYKNLNCDTWRERRCWITKALRLANRQQMNFQHTKIELCFIQPPPEESDVFPQIIYI